MTTLKIYYWDFHGGLENTRVLLKYLNVPYEEINPTQESWPALKQSFIDGGFNFPNLPNLPMIEDGDYKLSESKAIVSYLAEAKGDGTFAGKTPQDRGIIRQLEGVLDEAFNMLRLACMNPDYKTKIEEETKNPKFVRIADRIERHLEDGREYVLG